ncbi:hypothetical protein KKB69_01170 [Patescibacteria group bacterium]|nr:hypothetical protein [Patescibacteria group bacterium]
MDVNGINPKIFKAYDIRGVYKKDIDEDIFYALGKVFAARSKNGKIVVGRDIRLSSKSLSEAFTKGVLDYGLDVLNVGEVTTPMLYFAVGGLGGAGGAMITASHNPPEYNGIKFTDENTQPIGGKEIGELLKKINLENSNKRGAEKITDISEDYLNLICSNFKISREIKVNIDAKDSAVGLFLQRFLKKLGIEFWGGSCADFKASFDADGDRLKLFDENQNEIRGDIAGGIIADNFLKKGDLFVYDLISTRALRDYFGERGIETIASKIGHFYIKKLMKEKAAVFASEISGHYYFESLNYNESALFALRVVLEALDKNPALKISDLANRFSGYFHSGEINFPLALEEDWDKILEKLKNKYNDGQQNFEDGISVEYPSTWLRTSPDPADGGASWWFNLRPSNTEPIMRLVIEAKTKELMEQKKDEILDLLK